MKILAVAAVAMLAGSAQADMVLPLGDFDLAAGAFVTMDFDLSGTLTGWEISFDYLGNTDGSWSSDALFGVAAPNGAIEAGGYLGTYGFEDVGEVGDTSGDPGSFTHYFDTWASDVSGDGTWTMYVGDGWDFDAGELMSLRDVTFTLYGVVPAPGSLALLGLGGLALRRRR